MIKKKSFLVGAAFIASLTIGVACFAFASQQHRLSTVRGDPSPYSLNLSRSLTSEEVSAGTATFYNHVDYGIQFNFASASTSSGLVSLATGGYFYNETAITGMSRIEATLTSGSATLSYGNAKNVLNVGSQELTGTSLIVVDLEEPSDYFKIDDVTGPLAISSLRITYACSNSYQYAYDKETASGDILYSANLTMGDFGTETYPLDIHCFETVNESSGFSFHAPVSSTTTGWPNFTLTLNNAADLSYADLVVSVKANNLTNIQIGLRDASNEGLLKWNLSNTSISSNWQTLKFNIPANQIADGKDLSAVKKLVFQFNFDQNSGLERDIWIDEMHFADFAYASGSSGYNIETGTYSAGQWRGYGSTPETIYNNTCGANSYSALKVTFQDTTATLPGRVYASFDLAQTSCFGTSNTIDVKNSTLSFDIKLSQELYDTANSQFTFKHEDSSWSGIEKWYSFTGYNSGNPETWLHVSIDLSAKYGSETRNANTYAVTFGFFGMTAETAQTAWVIFDNLALTANS